MSSDDSLCGLKNEVTPYYNISQRRRKLIEKASKQRGSHSDKGCSEGGMHEKTGALNERKTRRPSGSSTQTRPKKKKTITTAPLPVQRWENVHNRKMLS